MNKDVTILIAEDDAGHAELIKKNLTRSGIANEIIHFWNGQEVLDYLYCRGNGPHRKPGEGAVLLLDIKMPKVNGTEVLEQLKSDDELCKIPVIMVTTTDDPKEVEQCHFLGCSNYITKPVEYDNFIKAIRQLGLFLSIVEVPGINGHH